ncbi:MAG: quinoprotein glucose dehydrogenase [Verrucomicrobiales bacterium]|jgi:quinoprotein glucose dehydrogenase
MNLKTVFAFIVCLAFAPFSYGADAEDLARKFQQLPTVPEAEVPELSNELGPFRGAIKHDGYVGHTWAAFPQIENAASLDVDPKGRVFVTEANRFWLGVPDLRGANEMIRDDFKLETVNDRLAMYEKFKANFPEGWFSKVADRIVRLEDSDGNGAPDRRTLFSDHFKRPQDGIGFSILAENDAVYFTCIPSVWKMTDGDDDGVADTHEEISTGYGVRVSFIGHDLHGVVRGPDGRLYFSVGDRSYNVTDSEGKNHNGAGRGAVFRCESDGSGLEVFATGLRNPQELAFDEFGNLFTFDNTGDIGDKARMVYVIEGSDSGWNMAHQSPHHYAKVLDWGEFRPPKSMWVEERMFDLWNETQPQWVYPPASHVSSGPSGFTYLTGDAVPEDLRNNFLLTDYRGDIGRSTTWAVSYEPKGAGYAAKEVREFVSGLAAADVEIGADGRIFFADFGGGWSVNTNASVQVLEQKSAELKEAGAGVAKLIANGIPLGNTPENTKLAMDLLGHPDLRVRQMAQFWIRSAGEHYAFREVAQNSKNQLARLHAMWGVGQLIQTGETSDDFVQSMLADEDPEIRANAARVLGDCRVEAARTDLLGRLMDDSLRVRSQAAIALGRICESGDAEAIDALYSANSAETDVVLRHSILSALDRIGTAASAVARVGSGDREQRLLAVLFLRRHESLDLTVFRRDADPQIQREVVRGIYDTAVLDTPIGRAVAQMNPKDLPDSLQRRVIAANYRLGKPKNAQRMLELAGDESLKVQVREYALHGLRMWPASIDTDPVLGHYRPQVVTDRSKEGLAAALTAGLRRFLTEKHDPKLVALATNLANEIGVALDESTLLKQVVDTSLDADVRVATLDSLAKLAKPKHDAIIRSLLDSEAPEVQAGAIRHAAARKLDGIESIALKAVETGPIPAARTAIGVLDQTKLEPFWSLRDSNLRKELWLDVYQQLLAAGDAKVQAWATAMMGNPQTLTLHGGDVRKGEVVFQNQGACLQCHTISGSGGVQGPDLTLLAERLKSDKILESLINPNAEISEGFGITTAILKEGTSVIGRITKETETHLLLTGLDGKEIEVKRADVATLTPPISAMPPMALALQLPDLRDLIAYLESRTKETAAAEDAASHGEGEDEKIAK